jgi:hypothetical protein
MTFTAITEDPVIQEGTFLFDYTCSGTVSMGQAVEAIGTMQVRAVQAADKIGKGCVGIAAYGQTDGGQIAVAGPGNICRIRVSGTGTATGDIMHSTYYGEWVEATGASEYLESGVKALALETQGTDGGMCRVLLY